jgi:calcium-dependent protein kinase
MDGEVFPKLSKHKISFNDDNSNQADIKYKENKSFKITKYNNDKIKILKHKSNLNIKHREYLNPIILSNNKPKYQSQKFIIYPKYMKDKIFLLNLPSSKKNIKDKIIIKKKSSKINNDKNNELLLKKEEFDNLPSFTKELRNALYSNSDISLENGLNKNGIENNSEKNSSEEKKKKENDSSQNSEVEEISDHMHEDNQTLMDVIKDHNLNDGDDLLKKENNLKNKENNTNEITIDKGKNNYKYQDVLLTISTTIPEVGIIKSNIENANKILISNYSTNITNESNSINSDINNNINIISSQNEIKKNDSIDMNEESQLKQEDKKITGYNEHNPQISNNENIVLCNQPSSKPEKRNSFNSIKVPIIMVPSSLQKDIRKIYKFKEKPLGGGNFGTVRKAYRKADDKNNREYYAIKSIPKKNLTEKDFTNLIKEVSIISGLSHPNIIKFYETYHDEHFFHLVMELCEGKDSYVQIVKEEKCDEKKVVNLIAKVLLAIAHCHSRGITHRDLKPENILFENNSPDAEIKIIDFGLSRKYSKDVKLHSVLGTPYYVAPEVLKGSYDQKCDIWSIGAMTYLLLCGRPPFNGSTDKEIFDNILCSEVKFDLPIWNNISNNAKSFVKLCLEKNGIKRPSAIKALDHPWFTNVLNATHRLQNLNADILMNIKNFNIKQKFKQMIIKHLLTSMKKGELKVYKNAFFAIDFFHNGCIEEPELKKAFKLKNIEITDEEINLLFKILDQNLKGALDYTEFLMAGVNRAELFTKEKLTRVFNYFDINKSGFIENQDLYDCLLRNGKQCINTKDINFFIYEALKDMEDKKGYDKDSEIFTKVSLDDFLKIFQDN